MSGTSIDTRVGGGGGGTPDLSLLFVDDPDSMPLSPSTDDVVIAKASSGSWLLGTKKLAGMYRYDGADWIRIAPQTEYNAYYIQGMSVDAPVAGNDGYYIQYDHANKKFKYAVPAGGAHNRQHDLDSTADHTSSIVEDDIMVADENGLPADSGVKLSELATSSHNHDLAYSAIDHDHDSDYAAALGEDDNYVTDAEKANLHAPGSDNQDLSGYSLTSHDHDSDYSAIGHDHDSDYSAIGHNHDTDYEPLKGEDDNYVTDAEKTKLSNLSGTNTGDQTLPVKASGAEVDTGSDDDKFVTAKAMEDSSYIKEVVSDTTPQLGGPLDMNGKAINYSAVLSSNETYEGDVATRTVDTNGLGFGAALYLASDGHYDTAKADSESTALVSALALETGTTSKKILLRGFICDTDRNWTVGGTIFLSAATAGELTQTAPGSGNCIVPVGIAVSADTMYFNPLPAIAGVLS